MQEISAKGATTQRTTVTGQPHRSAERQVQALPNHDLSYLSSSLKEVQTSLPLFIPPSATPAEEPGNAGQPRPLPSHLPTPGCHMIPDRF